MLHLAGRKTLGVNVGNLLELERAFQRDGIVNTAAQKEKILGAIVLFGQLLTLLIAGQKRF